MTKVWLKRPEVEEELFMLAGFVLLLVRCRKWSHRITVFSLVLLVFAFFTVVATKMPAYPFCLCTAGYHIAILTSHEVPDYLQSDPEVQKVDLDLWGDY